MWYLCLWKFSLEKILIKLKLLKVMVCAKLLSLNIHELLLLETLHLVLEEMVYIFVMLSESLFSILSQLSQMA